jgi:hypothetical protein
MNLGLSYTTQIRGGQQEGGGQQGLGGFVALTFNQLVSGVTAGWTQEHHDDDTHADIHADSISERGRTVANGVWTAVPFAASNFAGNAAMTVSVGTQETLAYTMYGKTMVVSFQLTGITVGGTPNTYIKIKIPGGYRSSRSMLNMIWASDNGTVRSAVVQAFAPNVAASDPYLYCALTSGGNWAASAAATLLKGQLSFEVL